MNRQTSWSHLFSKENEGNIAGIKRQIDRENDLKRGILKSIIQWKRIVDDMEGTYSGTTNSDSEYRLRYFHQQQYNILLDKEIVDLKTKLSLAASDKEAIPDQNNCLQCKSSDLKILNKNTKELKQEKCSLTSSIAMDERQLDRESMAFHKLRQTCDAILNDVIFQQKTKIEQQEKSDKTYFTHIRQNLHSSLYGKNHQCRTSCLGLAYSKASLHNTSQRRLVTNNSESLKTKCIVGTAKSQLSGKLPQNNKISHRIATKTGIKGKRVGSSKHRKVMSRKVNDSSQHGISHESAFDVPPGNPSNKLPTDSQSKPTSKERLRKGFNALKAFAAFKSSSKEQPKQEKSSTINTPENTHSITKAPTVSRPKKLPKSPNLPSAIGKQHKQAKHDITMGIKNRNEGKT